MSLPQLDTTVYLGQVFWLACSIVVVFCIMRFFTVPKMEKFFFKPIVDSEKIVDIILNVDKNKLSAYKKQNEISQRNVDSHKRIDKLENDMTEIKQMLQQLLQRYN